MTARLMVIDDDPLSLKLLSMLLEREGYAVMQGCSGGDALRSLEALDRASWPDAMLIDLQMPGLRGPDLAASLRRLTGEKLPLLAMSATAQNTPGGYDGFLLKPLDMGDLKIMLAEKLAEETPEASQPDDGSECATLDERIYKNLLTLMPEAALHEIYIECLRDTRARLGLMRSGDAQTVRAAAHAIKGSAGMLGATQLARRAALIEESGYQREGLPHRLNELLSACDALERILLRP